MHEPAQREAKAMEHEERTRTRQPQALRPSQRRIIDDAFQVPTRLKHIQYLPWLGCYQQQLRAENKSENTQKSYFYALRSLIETALPHEVLLSEREYNQLTVYDLVQRIEPNQGRIDLWVHSISDLKPTSFNARIAAARHFVKWLGWHWPEHLQRARTGKRLPRTLTKRELSEILEVVSLSENPVVSLLVTMMLDTGMRVSEVCDLNLADIDFQDFSARIHGGKGDKDRLVLFTQRTQLAFDRWLPIRQSIATSHDACFVNSQGRRLQPRGVQRIMDQIAIGAGLPKGKLTPHVLRHNFATGLLERGADLVTIQRLMGHATIATTRVYLEISDQTLREVYHRAQAMRTGLPQADQLDEVDSEIQHLTPSTSGVGIDL